MATIDQLKTTIEAATKELNSAADVTPGSVLGELVVKSLANAQLKFSVEVDSLKQGATISDALNSTEDTYYEAVDKIASNFDTQRNQGRKASGKIKLTVKTNKSYYFPAGFSFTQPALSFDFVTSKAYSANDTGSADLELKQEGGLFYVVIPVEAKVLTGSANVSNGTKFVLTSSGGLPEFVSAAAYGNFSSGQSKETDRELIARFKTGMSAKNLLSATAINSVLRDVAPNFKEASVVGIGDVELTRNKNNVFGIGLPGMVDVYVRTSRVITTTKLSVTGTKIVGGANDGRWQMTFGADAVPGFYRVTTIVQSKGDFLGTQQLVSTSYGVDTTTVVRANTVPAAKDARFTRYQTCTVVFDYTSSASSALFDVTVEHMPYLGEIQSLFLADTTRSPGADYLVKAVVPCNVTVFLKAAKKSATQTIDVAGMKKDIFDYVNGLPMGESVNASSIVNICHKYNVKQVELPVLMTGTILRPTITGNEVTVIRGTDTLTIPNLPADGISKLTTAFFLDYFDSTGKESIGIQLT